MLCPKCNQKMTVLFISAVCDHCEGKVNKYTYYVANVSKNFAILPHAMNDTISLTPESHPYFNDYYIFEVFSKTPINIQAVNDGKEYLAYREDFEHRTKELKVNVVELGNLVSETIGKI